MTVKHLTRTRAGKAFLSLVVLALLAVALQSLVFSNASFVSGSTNPGNVFTAGSLSHENSRRTRSCSTRRICARARARRLF